jgi:hypothetical protein
MGRAQTMGVRITDKKTILQWTADGKLQEVKVTKLPDEEPVPTETKGESKFGSFQNSKIGGGPKSFHSGFSTATTEVAFSNY